MAQSPEERSPGVLGRIGSWLSPWRTRSSPPVIEDASPTESSAPGQRESLEGPGEEGGEQTGRAGVCQEPLPEKKEGVAKAKQGRAAEPQASWSAEGGNSSLERNARHLRVHSGGSEELREHAHRRRILQVFLEETSVRQNEETNNSEPVVETTLKKSFQVVSKVIAKRSEVVQSGEKEEEKENEHADPGRESSLADPVWVTSDLSDQEAESDSMGRRNSGRRRSRKNSQGDEGGAMEKTPTSPPGNTATSPHSVREETHPGEESSQAMSPVPFSFEENAETPGSPEQGNAVCAARMETCSSEEPLDPENSPDAPVHATLACVIEADADMEACEDGQVVRLTESPKSKRKSMKVSHSEKFFAKKVIVSSSPPSSQGVSMKIKMHGRDPETTDKNLQTTASKMRSSNLKAKSDEHTPIQHKPRIADKISLFESGTPSVTSKDSYTLRGLDVSPARKVADRLKELSQAQGFATERAKSIERAGVRSSSAPPTGEKFPTVKERAKNLAAALRPEDKAELPLKSRKANWEQSKVTGQSQLTAGLDQTDSKSQNAMGAIRLDSGSKNDSKRASRERAKSGPNEQTPTASDAIKSPHVKSPTVLKEGESTGISQTKSSKTVTDMAPEQTKKPSDNKQEQTKQINDIRLESEKKTKETTLQPVLQDKSPSVVKPALGSFQTDSMSQSTIEPILPDLRDNDDSKTSGKDGEKTSLNVQTPTAPQSIETSQTKPSARSGSRSKRRKGKESSLPLSPTNRDQSEIKDTEKTCESPSAPEPDMKVRAPNETEINKSADAASNNEKEATATCDQDVVGKMAKTPAVGAKNTTSIDVVEKQTPVSQDRSPNDVGTPGTEDEALMKGKSEYVKQDQREGKESTRKKKRRTPETEPSQSDTLSKNSSTAQDLPSEAKLSDSSTVTSPVPPQGRKETEQNEEVKEKATSENKPTDSDLGKPQPSTPDPSKDPDSAQGSLEATSPKESITSRSVQVNKTHITRDTTSGKDAGILPKGEAGLSEPEQNDSSSKDPCLGEKHGLAGQNIAAEIQMDCSTVEINDPVNTKTQNIDRGLSVGKDEVINEATQQKRTGTSKKTLTRDVNLDSRTSLASTGELPATIDVPAVTLDEAESASNRPCTSQLRAENKVSAQTASQNRESETSASSKLPLPNTTLAGNQNPEISSLTTGRETAPDMSVNDRESRDVERSQENPSLSTLSQEVEKRIGCQEGSEVCGKSEDGEGKNSQKETNERMAKAISKGAEPHKETVSEGRKIAKGKSSVAAPGIKPVVNGELHPDPASQTEKQISPPLLSCPVNKKRPITSTDTSDVTCSANEESIPLKTLANKKSTTPPCPAVEKSSLQCTANEQSSVPTCPAKEKSPSSVPGIDITPPHNSSTKEESSPPTCSEMEKLSQPDEDKSCPASSSGNEKSMCLLTSANENAAANLSTVKDITESRSSVDHVTRKKGGAPKKVLHPKDFNAPGCPSLDIASVSSWLDVDQRMKPKSKLQVPGPKLSSSSSESNLLDFDFEPEAFKDAVKMNSTPFALPPRKHSHLRTKMPPFAMPAIREDRFEKMLDPDELQLGLRKKKDFSVTMSSSLLAQRRAAEAQRDTTDAKPKRSGLQRESILFRSRLLRGKDLEKHTGVEETEEQEDGKTDTDEEKGEQLKVSSRLERSTILSSLRNTTKGRRQELLSQTEASNGASPVTVPESVSPVSPPPEAQTVVTPSAIEQSSSDQVSSSLLVGEGITKGVQDAEDAGQVTTKAISTAGPSMSPTGSPVLPSPHRDLPVDTTAQSSPPTSVLITPPNLHPIPPTAPTDHLPATTKLPSSPPDLRPPKSLPTAVSDSPAVLAKKTVAQTTVTDNGPPRPSFDVKLPDYLEKFLPKSDHQETLQSQRGGEIAAPVCGSVNSGPAIQPQDDRLQPVQTQVGPNLSVVQEPRPDPYLINAVPPTVRGFHRRPGKIVIFEHPQFKGQAFEIFRDVPDTTSLTLSPLISVRVVRGCWVLYEKPGFEGRCIALEEGPIELANEWADEAVVSPDTPPSAPMVIGSIRLAVRDYSPPHIDLFTDPRGMGRLTRYHDDMEEICDYGLPQSTSSIKIHSGMWLVYSEAHFQGLLSVLGEGEYPCPEAWGFPTPTVGSIRALRMGCLKVENPTEVKALLYEEPGLQGRCVEVQEEVFCIEEEEEEEELDGGAPRLKSVGSMKILSGLWLGYELPGFEGQQYVLEEGEYLDWRDWGGLSEQLQSLQPILSDFLSPHMRMYSEPDFGERGVDINVSGPVINMEDTGYGLKSQSIDVLAGVWVAFEEAGFAGPQYLLEKGLYNRPEDWGSGSSRVSSVMPVCLDNLAGSSKFRMQLFPEVGLRGTSVLVEDKLPTMPEGFALASCRVLTGSWLAFQEQAFIGQVAVLEEGDYPDLRAMGFTQPDPAVRSLQPTGHEFSPPSIVLFERTALRGRRVPLTSGSVNLQLTAACSRVQSVLVEGGMWVLYEAINFRGSQILLRPGDVPDWHKLSGWQRIGSLRPLIQKPVHFCLRNDDTGLLMSVTGSLDDLKMARIQATEETGGMEQIWTYQCGLLQCKVMEDYCVEPSGGVLVAGSRASLSAEPGKDHQLWSVGHDGLIRSHRAPHLVLEVKGGQHYDRNQVILNEYNASKRSQRWSLDIL